MQTPSEPQPDVLKSLLVKLGQDEPGKLTRGSVPPEFQELLYQLPKYIKNREGALEGIKRAYDEDPRIKFTPFQAEMRGMFGSGNVGDVNAMVASGNKGRMDQEKFIFDQKLAREKELLEGYDFDVFDKLQSTVAKNLKNGRDDRFVSSKVRGGNRIVNERTGEGYWDVGPVDVFQLQADYKKTLLNYANSKGLFNKEIGWDEQGIDEAAKRLASSYANGTEEEQQKVETTIRGIKNDSVENKPKAGVPAEIALNPKLPNAEITPEQRKIIIGMAKLDGTPLPEGFNVPKAMSLQTEKTLEETGKLQANEHANDIKARDAAVEAQQSIDIMGEILASGKNTSGVLHKELNKFGSFMSYIDPKSTLATAVGNDALYNSSIMNLVRDKIKVLGVNPSNADLNVTKDSLGSLMNTPDGNKKISAIMQLMNHTLQSKLGTKIDHWKANKNYDNYTPSKDATHIIRHDSTNGNYWIQTRSGWIASQIKRGMEPGKAERSFNSEALRASSNLVKGTGITFGGGK